MQKKSMVKTVFLSFMLSLMFAALMYFDGAFSADVSLQNFAVTVLAITSVVLLFCIGSYFKQHDESKVKKPQIFTAQQSKIVAAAYAVYAVCVLFFVYFISDVALFFIRGFELVLCYLGPGYVTILFFFMVRYKKVRVLST